MQFYFVNNLGLLLAKTSKIPEGLEKEDDSEWIAAEESCIDERQCMVC